MRADTDADRLRRLLAELGRHARPGDRLYLSGGGSALLVGWREYTHDVDVRLEADDPDPMFRAIASLKDRLDVNIELAGPLDFLPEPAGWRDRSSYLGRFGQLDVFHTDFTLQALAKLQRGFALDLSDVAAMLDRRLTSKPAIRETFVELEPAMFRFPGLDPDRLRDAIEQLPELEPDTTPGDKVHDLPT